MPQTQKSQSMKIKPSTHKKLRLFSIINGIEMGKIVEISLIHYIYHKDGWLTLVTEGRS